MAKKKKKFEKWLKMYFYYVFIMNVILFLAFKFSSTIYYFDVCLENIYSIIVGISLDLLGQLLLSLSRILNS